MTGEALKTIHIGQGMLFSNADTMKRQMADARELYAAEYPPGSVVLLGLLYPETVVLHRNDLEIAYSERDLSAVSLLSDRGVAEDRRRNVRFVWLLKYETLVRFWRDGARFYATADAFDGTLRQFRYRLQYFDTVQIETAARGGSVSGR
jgi:hypothetical protein